MKISAFWIMPIIIVSGLVGFYTSHFSFFQFKGEIDLVNLFTLIISSCFGWYIAYNLPKKINANKFEKELLYEIIKPLKIRIKTFLKEVESNNLDFNRTVASFKDISSYITEIEDLNDMCSVADECDFLISIRRHYASLKPLITMHSPEGDFIRLSIEDKKKSILKFKLLIDNINNLMIYINRR